MTTQQRFTGELTHQDAKKHLPIPFDVPKGTTQVQISFHYSPDRGSGQRYTNQISLSLFDPEGSRGARHNNKDQNIRLNANYSSPGYIPGAILPGPWSVVIDTHRILPPEPVTYELEIALSDDPVADHLQHWPKPTRNTPGPGWYRGDLHGHTLHSDGHWDVPDFVEHAREIGLDFVTLTDHNTVSALAQHDSLADDTFLTMGGMELTTYYGHALALGTRKWVEWRIGAEGAPMTMQQLAANIMQAGSFFVTAHPRSVGDPECTGCRWEYTDMMPGNSPAYEIWNGPWHDHDSNNEEGLQLYYEWLNQGHRIVATSGTDIHGKPSPELQARQRSGYNVVYADDLTENAILSAIRLGHLYISSGPDLRLTAQTNDHPPVMMGDSIQGDEISVKVVWDNAFEGDTLRLIVDGHRQEIVHAGKSGQANWELLSSNARWFNVELRDQDGGLRAVTNPIFVI